MLLFWNIWYIYSTITTKKVHSLLLSFFTAILIHESNIIPEFRIQYIFLTLPLISFNEDKETMPSHIFEQILKHAKIGLVTVAQNEVITANSIAFELLEIKKMDKKVVKQTLMEEYREFVTSCFHCPPKSRDYVNKKTSSEFLQTLKSALIAPKLESINFIYECIVFLFEYNAITYIILEKKEEKKQ